ncbi:hypothetical protein QR680_007396 [Steinernema hermaphroditum]|uniref:Uncharacterized protein n=1 Tax=Steinernema hermaphroditum TaxID=289476 RepID=A0AA39M6C5_9BILA|nr:hypothetical protein QR680_007396 [Steinernema hermaphroditum]
MQQCYASHNLVIDTLAEILGIATLICLLFVSIVFVCVLFWLTFNYARSFQRKRKGAGKYGKQSSLRKSSWRLPLINPKGDPDTLT